MTRKSVLFPLQSRCREIPLQLKLVITFFSLSIQLPKTSFHIPKANVGTQGN